MTASKRNHRVCILAYNGLCFFEFGIAIEIFALPRPEITPWYQTEIVAIISPPLKTTFGLSIDAQHDLKLLLDASLIIVPGWDSSNTTPALIHTLLKAHKSGTRIASICSGAFLLAQCGLLNGKRATTHWRYADQLKQQYPLIEVCADNLYIDENNVLTSAGSAAGLDLCMHIIRSDFGIAVAN